MKEKFIEKCKALAKKVERTLDPIYQKVNFRCSEVIYSESTISHSYLSRKLKIAIKLIEF